MMPALPGWLWTQEAVVIALLALGSVVIWLWHHQLTHAPHPTQLTPMSDRWLQDRELFRDQHR